MKRTRLGPLDAVICGGEDREGGGDGPVVVLLHGFGAPGEDLVPLWREVDAPREVRWVFPAAPLPVDELYPGARAWWMIDLERMQRMLARSAVDELVREVPAGLAPARAAVDAVLDDVERTLRPSSLVLGGFSQGACLASEYVWQHPARYGGLVAFSGGLIGPQGMTWQPSHANVLAGMPAFLGCSDVDSHVPKWRVEESADVLRAMGADVTLRLYAGMGHLVNDDEIAHARAVIQRVMA